MNFIWFQKKISRFYTKLIINNFKRLVFNSYYFLLEGFNRAYYENKKKRGLKKLKIKYPIIAPIRFNGVSFLIFLNSSGLLEDRLISKVGFEVCLLDLADYFIKEDTTIIDVGANLGIYSLYFSKKYTSCQVHSYEPVSSVFKSFKRSADINNLTNLHPYLLAVGSDCCETEIYAATEATYNKGLSSILNNFDLNETYIKEKINVISLDSHIKNYKKVSFIKIDVQGLEKNVLDGALEIIKRDNPVIIFEHSDLYFKVPSETRKHISDLLSLQSYEIYLIRSGENEFKYLFLEDIDFRNSSDNIDGDFIAIPRGLPAIEQINVQQKH